MAEVIYGLVSEARKNRFSAIPKLTEEGKLIEKPRTPIIESLSVVLSAFFNLILSLLTYFDVVDIVNVWDNVSKFIERQMALQKVSKFSRVLKFLFTHVQWNVSCTASFARLVSRKFHYRCCRSQ